LELKIEAAPARIQGYTQKDTHGENWSAPPIPNGIISTSVRLGIAIRYFAGKERMPKLICHDISF